jgi:plasmid stabilization system protein ParE
MSFVLEFLPEASAEVECITGDYEARSPGLGIRFRYEVESACAAIVQHPFLWRVRLTGYRRVNLPGFPYYIAFVTEEQQALVIAVAHASRHPDYFKARFP